MLFIKKCNIELSKGNYRENVRGKIVFLSVLSKAREIFNN